MEHKLFLTRVALPLNLVAFAYLLMSKSTNVALWLIFLVFIYGQVIYHLTKNQNRNRWINAAVVVSGLIGLLAYFWFA